MKQQMMLLTKEVLKTFEKVGGQDHKTLDEVLVIAKFFHPFCSWTRYATEFNPQTGIFYGLVDGDFVERGTFSLEEFKQLYHGIPFERDRYFKQCSAREILDTISKERGGFM